jgi:DNA-binding NarL/FixJ family response regulator
LEAAIGAITGRQPFDVIQARVIGAEVIGGPHAAAWLRATLDLCGDCGLGPNITDRIRRQLREAGGTVPRRKRAATELPAHLAAAGITSREAEVLRLIGEGSPNAVIAQRLYLSVRTVESHVSSLLRKLGAENRSQLMALNTGTNVT